MPGLQDFTASPVFQTPVILDGVELAGIPVPLTKKPSRPANLLTHMDGRVTVQLDYTGADQPDTLEHYSWTFPLTARDEAVWYALELVRKRGTAVYLITWDQEEEVFTVGTSLTSFSLPRAVAKSVSSHSDLPEYPTKAWVNGVAKTVIESGSPTSSEVKVVGAAVTTSTLVAGDVLRVRAVVAYKVVVAELPQLLDLRRVLSREVTLVEANS